jgi:phosphopantetheinyl transferase
MGSCTFGNIFVSPACRQAGSLVQHTFAEQFLNICKLKSKIFNQKILNSFMPLVYQQNINAVTKLGVWHIAETEEFFAKIPLQKQITHWHKRLQHLAGRHLLQELYPKFPLSLIQIADTKKPFLGNEKYHFSISHCGDYVAAIVSKHNRVGVDVEIIAPKAERLKDKFLSASEQALLAKMDAQIGCTLFWCVKEAVYKWYGVGGLDFKIDMPIQNITGHLDEGFVSCNFKNQDKLPVHYLVFNNNCLAWVLSEG